MSEDDEVPDDREKLRPDPHEAKEMSRGAWQVRERSHLVGKTAVGCAALGADGTRADGCNVEHRYRCHDVHAEVNAITNLVAQGCKELRAVLIAARRSRFTPCGGCLDWIFQFGGSECWVGYQSDPDGEIKWHRAGELMPLYPE